MLTPAQEAIHFDVSAGHAGHVQSAMKEQGLLCGLSIRQ